MFCYFILTYHYIVEIYILLFLFYINLQVQKNKGYTHVAFISGCSKKRGVCSGSVGEGKEKHRNTLFSIEKIKIEGLNWACLKWALGELNPIFLAWPSSP